MDMESVFAGWQSSEGCTQNSVVTGYRCDDFSNYIGLSEYGDGYLGFHWILASDGRCLASFVATHYLQDAPISTTVKIKR
jgi:hypothetical protein